jgi:predicted permease
VHVISDLWMRMRALVRRNAVEGELDEEIRFHFAQQVEKYVASGVSREEATRRARVEFGGLEQVKEECREARGVLFLETLAQDARYALRGLRKNPGFTTVALLTIALGIGATTVMFAVVNGVLLRPLPYRNPDRLVAVHGYTEGWNTKVFGEQNVAYLDFLDAQRASRTLEIAGFLYGGGTVVWPAEAEYVDAQEISSNLFSVLGVRPVLGRAFLPEEDRAGASPVAILGYSFWERRFTGNAGAIGSSITFEGKRYTVVGVMPAHFELGGEQADVYTPLSQDTERFMTNRNVHAAIVIARLRPGATLAQARDELALIGTHLAQEYASTNAGRTFLAARLRPRVGAVRSTLWLLLGAVGLVLLIACANVASLLLARAVSRERELAMRAALGASKGRLVRQCLTESAVLGISGGALGVLLANIGIQPFVALWPGSLPRAEGVHLDWRVLLFAVGASLLSGFLFGLAPAVRTPSRGLETALRSGARTISSGSRRLHSAFVVAEISLAMVLLVAAGMLGRTLLELSSLSPGLDIRNVLVARAAISPAVFASAGRTRAAWQDFIGQARRVPGVQSVAMVDTVPLREGNNEIGYWPNPYVPPESKQPMALATCVTTDYLKVMHMPLLSGRFLTDQDRAGGQLVVVIDDVLARDAFGGRNPIGERLWMPDMGYGPFTVVGVVGHVRYWGLAADDQSAIRAQFYYPFAQLPDRMLRRWSELMSIAVRTNVAPLSVVASLREALRGASGDQVLYEVRTMEQLTQESLALHRFLLTLFGIFAGLAMLLACVGIYGVLAYLTGQRVPEIGVRMALGATRGKIMQMILRQSSGIIFLGAGLGLLGALVAGRILAHVVDGMRPLDVPTLAMAISCLAAAALIASFAPAYRASHVDPMVALRQE